MFTLALALLPQCAHGGRTEHFPAPRDPAASADVFVFRNRNVFGMAVAKPVRLDGWVIAKLGPGEWVRFQVEPGPHSVGGGEGSAAFEFEPSAVYYFLMTPAGFSDNFEIERLTPEEAAPLMEEYEAITD